MLAASGEKLFVATAGLTDLVLLDWAASAAIPAGKAYLYVHWFNASPRKLERLRRIARRQPELAIFAPMESILGSFREVGFRNVSMVPYPISESVETEPAPFGYLLYAGAARQDKGFGHVVNLVARLQAQGLQIPLVLQASAEHYGKYDTATQEDMRRLQALDYPQLRQLPDTLDQQAYAALFAGAVCLQLYSREDFADRISGVTLDALSAGCPIITTAGTWTARTVQRFDAGIIVESTAPQATLSAIRKIIAEYSRYSKNARTAGRILQQENSAGSLFNALMA